MPEETELVAGKTTVARVRLTANELSSATDEAIEMFIDDAFSEVDDLFPDKFKERACRFLACHLAVLNNQNTRSEQLGPLKREYSGFHTTFTDLKRTVYGQEYRRLLTEYTDAEVPIDKEITVKIL